MGSTTGGRRMLRTVGVLLAGMGLVAACSGGGGDVQVEPDRTEAPDTTAPDDTEVTDSVVDTTSGADSSVTTPAPQVLVPDREIATEDSRDWTVLVYLNAKNDLEPFATLNLDQMASVTGVQGTVHIVALVGRTGEFSTDPGGGVPAFNSTKLLEADGNGSMTELADFGPVNMGQPGALRDFISLGVSAFPASRYALVMWDHGAGWVGYGVDEFGENVELLDLPEIVDQVSGGLADSGLSKFDVIGFDACLMSTYEVAAALQPSTNYLVASQELVPGHGWDYTALQLLADDPSTDGAALGENVLSRFYDYAQQAGTSDDITMALLDMSKMDAVTTALGDWTTEVSGSMSTVAAFLGRDRATSLSFAKSPDPSEDPGLVDLGDLVTLMGQEDGSLTDAGTPLLAAIDDLVVDEVNGSATVGATGLSIYFPVIPDVYNGDYDAVETGQVWRSLLASYFDAGNSIPDGSLPRFQNPDREAAVQFTDTGAVIGGLLDEGSLPNITDTTFYYGLTESADSVVVVGEESADVDDQGLVTANWDFDLLTLTQGDVHGYGYLTFDTDPETNQIYADVPFLYTAPDGTSGDVLLEVIFDGDTEEVLQQTYFVQNEDGAYGELTPEEGSTIVPEFLRVTGAGQTEWFTDDAIVFDATVPPTLDLETIPKGTNIYVRLVATDFGGNTDYVQEQGVLP